MYNLIEKLFKVEKTYNYLILKILGIKIKFRLKANYLPQKSDSKVKISVVINTYNADRMLKKAIQSVIKADEIVVCDMHSNDKTIEIAKKYDCKIVYHEKLPQPDPARNFAISKASGDWILILDADEIVSSNLWQYLVNYANSPIAEKLVINIPRKNWFLDGFLTTFGDDYQLRFFKKGHILYEEGHVHVPPKVINTEILTLKSTDKDLVIYHYSCANFTHFLARQNAYTSEEVKKADLSLIKESQSTIFSIFIKHIKKYFKNKIYIDGFKGLIWFLYDIFYELTSYMKKLEVKENYEEKQLLDASSKIKF